jgi:hypothetical protein
MMLAWLNRGGTVILADSVTARQPFRTLSGTIPASRSPALPALSTARRCACALVQVLADIAGHRAQVT